MKVARSLKSCRRVAGNEGWRQAWQSCQWPIFSTQMLFLPKYFPTKYFPPEYFQSCQWPIFSIQMLFLPTAIVSFFTSPTVSHVHELSIYHFVVDKGNYCDLYQGWGRLADTVCLPCDTEGKSSISFLSIFHSCNLASPKKLLKSSWGCNWQQERE